MVPRTTVLAYVLFAVCGCATPPSARYVYQDCEFGVIGIPQNTFQGKANYRAQAELLMSRHFPAGYEIVRAEEVIEGEKLLDLGKRTDMAAQVAAANQLIALGRLARATSFEEKDKVQARECRIIYRKKTADVSTGAVGFAHVTSLNPPLYIDPNEILRRQAQADRLAKSSPAPKKADGPDSSTTPLEPSKVNVNPWPPAIPGVTTVARLTPDWCGN